MQQLKAIGFCALFTLAAYTALNLLMLGAAFSVPGVLIVGAGGGVVIGGLIYLFGGNYNPIFAGAVTAAGLYALFMAVALIGAASLNFVALIIAAICMAVVGAAGGFGYKLGSR